MKNKTKLLPIMIIVIGVLIVMSLFSTGAFASYKEINEEKTYPMDDAQTILVTMTSTPVHIIHAAGAKEMTFHLYGQAKRNIELVSGISNGTLVVEVKRELGALPIPEDITLDIHVPSMAGKNLSIKTSSGDITIDPLNVAALVVDTTSGGLGAESITADKVSMTTSSGKLHLQKLDARELKIKGSSASINIDEYVMNDKQKVDIQTSSGDITLGLPAASEFVLKAEATSGKVQSDFVVAGITDKKKIDGQIGNKSNTVTLKATSGNISIIKK